MSRKEEYKLKNEEFLAELAANEDIKSLPCGVLYKVINEGNGTKSPTLSSVVSVHYRGTLINGREFDNSYKRNSKVGNKPCSKCTLATNGLFIFLTLWDMAQGLPVLFPVSQLLFSKWNF